MFFSRMEISPLRRESCIYVCIDFMGLPRGLHLRWHFSTFWLDLFRSELLQLLTLSDNGYHEQPCLDGGPFIYLYGHHA